MARVAANIAFLLGLVSGLSLLAPPAAFSAPPVSSAGGVSTTSGVPAVSKNAPLATTAAKPAPAAVDPVPEDKDAAYLKLVDAAMLAPAQGKWCEIRRRYAETSFYRAHSGTEVKNLTAEAGKKILLEKTPAAAAAFKAFMHDHAGSASAHYYAAYLYNWNNDLVKQKMDPLLPDFGHGIDYIDGAFEKGAAATLLDCIVAGADGRSAASAYQVISIDEEELVADKYYHVEPIAIDRSVEGGKIYNVMTVQIPGTRAPIELYFHPSSSLIDGEMAQAQAEHMKDRRAFAALGGAPPGTSTAGDAAYLAAVAEAIRNPSEATWGELRMLYAASSFYKPDAGFLLEKALADAETKAGTEKTPQAVAEYQGLLRDHFGQFVSHMNALDAYATYKPAYINQDRETAAVRGLVKSIVRSGDGSSMETAFKVIDTDEEYIVLGSYFHLKPTGQKLVPDHGHTYDVLSYQDPKTGAEGKMFFNVDKMMGK